MIWSSFVLLLATFLVVRLLSGAQAFITPVCSSRPPSLHGIASASEDTTHDNKDSIKSKRNTSRRVFTSQLVTAAIGAIVIIPPESASAGIDVSSLKTLPIEGDASGAAARLKQLQQKQGGDSTSMTTRVGAVSYREISAGRDGARTIRSGSNVGAEVIVLTPKGLQCYSTKEDNDSNELAWTIGSGDLPRALEEGMMGMKLNAVRRIEIPSQFIFAARNAGQLPEATTEIGKQRYDTLFQSGDATLVFEVFVTGINQGDNRI